MEKKERDGKRKATEGCQPNHKRCSQCKLELHQDKYGSCLNGLLGKRAKCLSCERLKWKAYSETHSKENRERVRLWKIANPEKCKIQAEKQKANYKEMKTLNPSAFARHAASRKRAKLKYLMKIAALQGRVYTPIDKDARKHKKEEIETLKKQRAAARLLSETPEVVAQRRTEKLLKRRQYEANNREALAAKRKISLARTKDRRMQLQREKRAANPDLQKAYTKQRYHSAPEKYLAISKSGRDLVEAKHGVRYNSEKSYLAKINLEDSFVAGLVSRSFTRAGMPIKKAEIPRELIEARRIIIKLKREHDLLRMHLLTAMHPKVNRKGVKQKNRKPKLTEEERIANRKASLKRYVDANRAKINEASRLYSKNNRDVRNAYQQKFRLKQKELAWNNVQPI